MDIPGHEPVVEIPRRIDWLTLVSEATSRDVKVRRVRIVSEPVSQYVQFEYEVTNGLNIAAGEEVRCFRGEGRPA